MNKLTKLLLLLALIVLPAIVVLPTQSEAAESCANTPTSPNSVTYSVNIPEANTYTIWSRMIVPNTADNSFYLQVDGGCATIVGDSSAIPAETFTWVNYKDGNTSAPITMNLSAGSHTVKLTEREPGVGIDKLIFTTDAACVPSGNGNNCSIVATPTVSPTPSEFSATIGANPATSSVTVNTPINIDVVVNGGGNAFNAAQATVAVSANLSITQVASPSANPCNFTYASEAPTVANPSFAGAILSSSSTQCNVYRMTVLPTATGAATITFSNASVKAFSDNRELLSSVQNGTYTINAVATPTPTTTIAPTVTTGPTPGGTTTTTLNPVADTVADSTAPNSNFGTLTSLTNDGDPIKISYMKFDTAALAGRTLVSATLRMYVNDMATNTHNIKDVPNTSWTETGLTYNNRPALGSTIQSIHAPQLNTWVTADITSGLTGKLGQNIALAVDTAGTEGYGFNSREAASNKVELVIVSQSATPSAVPTATTVPPTATPTNTPTPTNAPPTATPTNTPTPTATPTPTDVPTDVPTPTPTNTPVPLEPPTIGSTVTSTYDTNTLLAGSRPANITKIYINDQSTGVTYATPTSWQKTVALSLGNNVLEVVGEDADGDKTDPVSITITRHKLSDIDGDSVINLGDLSLFALDWLKTSGFNPLSDMNSDGFVNLTDFSILAKQYGQ